MKLHEVKLFRWCLLRFLARWNPGDIRIRHHYTGDPVWLHSFRHKGYWFHGRKRERSSMDLFRRLLRPGDSVVEVGGHIGYISLYFKHLVGSTGRVVVFEPGANNLPYLRRNFAGREIEWVEKAAGDRMGSVEFYLDSLTGQNNSCVPNFEGFRRNQANAFVGSARVEKVTVEMVTLDEYLEPVPKEA